MRSSLHSIKDTGVQPPPPVNRDQQLVALVWRAGEGDERAWEQLHTRFTPMLRGIARSYRLSPSDVDDVIQTVWLRLLDHIGRLREPAAVAGWLASTTRRECLRLLQRSVRERPSDDPALGDGADPVEPVDPERVLLATERREVLRRALATLPERQRDLMTLLATDPAIDYWTVGMTLAMPVGSIGPIRARGLARLRRHPELHCFCSSNC